MTEVKVTLSGSIRDLLTSKYQGVAEAATAAMTQAGDEVKGKARANIASAGFGSRWQNALRVTIYPKGKASASPAAFVYHKIPYADVFESGATIRGKPMLWIPLKSTPRTTGGRQLRPKDIPGKLVSLNVPGRRPLLGVNMEFRTSAGRQSVTAEQVRRRRGDQVAAAGSRTHRSGVTKRFVPLFFGINQVTIRKRFSIRQICEQAAAELPDLFMHYFKDE